MPLSNEWFCIPQILTTLEYNLITWRSVEEYIINCVAIKVPCPYGMRFRQYIITTKHILGPFSLPCAQKWP